MNFSKFNLSFAFIVYTYRKIAQTSQAHIYVTFFISEKVRDNIECRVGFLFRKVGK